MPFFYVLFESGIHNIFVFLFARNIMLSLCILHLIKNKCLVNYMVALLYNHKADVELHMILVKYYSG